MKIIPVSYKQPLESLSHVIKLLLTCKFLLREKKLENELQQIEEKFESKKRKFNDDSEKFNDALKKLCEPPAEKRSEEKEVNSSKTSEKNSDLSTQGESKPATT